MGRTAVEGALSKLYTRHNVHLWVAYVDDFSGRTPARWAEDTMRANGFTDTDGLLAVDTANHTFAFRPPAIMTNGTPWNSRERRTDPQRADRARRAPQRMGTRGGSCGQRTGGRRLVS